MHQLWATSGRGANARQVPDAVGGRHPYPRVGIGLSTTVFCVVNGGLFKGLPFADADRIVALVATNHAQNQPRQPISVHDLAVCRRGDVLDKFGAYGLRR